MGNTFGSEVFGLTTTSLASIFFCFCSFFTIRFGFGAGFGVKTWSVFLGGGA
jgi:hypothetical protein